MLSVVILTFNSQKYIKNVLESTKFADEVLILDSGSSDETLNIASNFQNVKIIKQTWLGFGKMKALGANLAKNEWIFTLDSDEIFTKELENEVKAVLQNPKFYAYKVPRLNFFFGKPVRNLGLYPDFSTRLFNKNFANFNDLEVHESVCFFDSSNKFGKLDNHFLHYAYENIAQFIEKQNKYSSLGAKKSKFKALFSPSWTFFRLFVLKKGFLDGWRGFVIAKLYAQYTFWKYIK